MRCPSEDHLRAWLVPVSDTELDAHLSSCDRCSARLHGIRQTAQVVQQNLDVLGGGSDGLPDPDPAAALRKFKANLERNHTMSEFGRRRSLRPVLAGGVLVVALLAAFLVAPVRSAAVGLFDVFRVERFALITVDTSKLPVKMHSSDRKMHDGEAKPDLNAFGTYTGPTRLEKPERVASLAAASERVNSRLATAGDVLEGFKANEVYVTRPVQASYTFDVDKMRQKIAASGLQGVKAPEQLDGKTFTLNVDEGVLVRYGTEENGAVFAQGPSPELTIPEGVNMNYLRQDFLLIPGLPADLVAQVQEIEDWERTLIIPVPANGSSQEVRINGAEGVLISSADGKANGVLWQRDGRLYAIGGTLTSEQALGAARAVQYP